MTQESLREAFGINLGPLHEMRGPSFRGDPWGQNEDRVYLGRWSCPREMEIVDLYLQGSLVLCNKAVGRYWRESGAFHSLDWPSLYQAECRAKALGLIHDYYQGSQFAKPFLQTMADA